MRIVTLPWDQAKVLRRLEGELYVGCGCNLYMLRGELCAVEGGSFAYARWTGEGFEYGAVNRPTDQAVLTMEPAAEPFIPPYAEELSLGGPRERIWRRMHVSSPDGWVRIEGEYDAAQIYADGQLAADNFFSGEQWLVPASLLYGRVCYLVMSELKDDCYLEYRVQRG